MNVTKLVKLYTPQASAEEIRKFLLHENYCVLFPSHSNECPAPLISVATGKDGEHVIVPNPHYVRKHLGHLGKGWFWIAQGIRNYYKVDGSFPYNEILMEPCVYQDGILHRGLITLIPTD